MQVAARENPHRYDGCTSGDSLYNYFRDYDPSIGRYFESDPIGLRAGNNTYGYVESGPLSFADRWGLDATDWSTTPGRSVTGDGPRNGMWCGGNWSGGKVPSINGGRDGSAAPVDSLDRCCMVHDKCFGKCEAIPAKAPQEKCRYECNRSFVGCLKDLGSN